MIDINIDLHIPFVLFRILPEIGKGWVEESSADGICIRHISPFLLTCIEKLIEVGPARHIRLHVDDVLFVGCEGIEVGCRLEVCNKNTRTERMGLFRYIETNAFESLGTRCRLSMERAYLMRLP